MADFATRPRGRLATADARPRRNPTPPYLAFSEAQRLVEERGSLTPPEIVLDAPIKFTREEPDRAAGNEPEAFSGRTTGRKRSGGGSYTSRWSGVSKGR